MQKGLYFSLVYSYLRNQTKNNLNTKIIVITASNKSENRVKCLNSGADLYLPKPYEISALIKWVDMLLN